MISPQWEQWRESIQWTWWSRPTNPNPIHKICTYHSEGDEGNPSNGHRDEDEDDNQGPAWPLQFLSARCFLRIKIKIHFTNGSSHVDSTFYIVEKWWWLINTWTQASYSMVPKISFTKKATRIEIITWRIVISTRYHPITLWAPQLVNHL